MSIGEFTNHLVIGSVIDAKQDALYLMTYGIKDEHTNKHTEVPCISYLLFAVLSKSDVIRA
jgi:hypothetical protein